MRDKSFFPMNSLKVAIKKTSVSDWIGNKDRYHQSRQLHHHVHHLRGRGRGRGRHEQIRKK